MFKIPRPTLRGLPLTHPLSSKPAISLGLTSLSLLLLVLVLLSVPGPIKGLYWFSVENDIGDEISAGVLGWCSMSFPPCPMRRLLMSLVTKTSNCTYAPLSYVPLLFVIQADLDSDNPYLSDMIDSGQALTVRIMLPTGKYPL